MTEGDLINEIYSTIADPGRWSEVIVGDCRSSRMRQEEWCIHAPRPAKAGRSSFSGGCRRSARAIYQSALRLESLVLRDEGIAVRQGGRSATPAGARCDLQDRLLCRRACAAGAAGHPATSVIVRCRATAALAASASPSMPAGCGAGAGQRAPSAAAQPHLGRALDASIEMGRAAGGAQKLGAILDVMPGAALLLDRERTDRACERHCRVALLREGDGLSFDRTGRLQLAAVLPTELATSDARAEPCAAGCGRHGRRIVRAGADHAASGAGPLLVVPVPLPPPAFELWEMLDTRACWC